MVSSTYNNIFSFVVIPLNEAIEGRINTLEMYFKRLRVFSYKDKKNIYVANLNKRHCDYMLGKDFFEEAMPYKFFTADCNELDSYRTIINNLSSKLEEAYGTGTEKPYRDVLESIVNANWTLKRIWEYSCIYLRKIL